MLPSSVGGRYAPCRSAHGDSLSISWSLPDYLRRVVDYHQMDLEATADQMVTLLTVNPQGVYKTAYYRKQTKNHWARDDPGFAVLQALFLIVATCAYGVVFNTRGFWGYVGLLMHGILLHWLLCGVIMSSSCRWLANGQLLQHRSHSVLQEVEWMYAFDIHCNSFFPLFVLLYVVQLLLLPILLGRSIAALVLSNTLYAGAFSIYFYVTHLGYRALPFLHKTEVFLYPVVGIVVLLVVSIILAPLGLSVNATRAVASLYMS
ncbi:unnamed protein product [Discosporangium mesarthrocarpum]